MKEKSYLYNTLKYFSLIILCITIVLLTNILFSGNANVEVSKTINKPYKHSLSGSILDKIKIYEMKNYNVITKGTSSTDNVVTVQVLKNKIDIRDIKVRKNWNIPSTMVNSYRVTFKLVTVAIEDGEEVETDVLDDNNQVITKTITGNGEETFRNLLMYDEDTGKKIDYKVKEIKVEKLVEGSEIGTQEWEIIPLNKFSVNYTYEYVADDSEETNVDDNTEGAKASLVSQITSDNYGDKVNYSVKANGQDVPNTWSIFHNDGEYVYIIYDDYLPVEYINTTLTNLNGMKINTTTPYSVYGVSEEYYHFGGDFVDQLTNTSNWSDFVRSDLSSKGATANRSTYYSDMDR